MRTIHVLLIFRRPPTSPLFPSTTLFRSHAAPAHVRGQVHHVRVALDDHPFRQPDRTRRRHAPEVVAAEIDQHGVLDRKSTRLNSSHTVISYVVFCLKKKKKRSVDNSFIL